jgi:hypothetical protein
MHTHFSLKILREEITWKDDIEMDHKEIGCEDVGWIHLAQDMVHWQSLVNIVVKLWVS